LEPADAGRRLNIEELLNRLTLEEKASLCSGLDAWSTKPVPRLGIPSIKVADGPHGLRKQRDGSSISLGSTIPSTCFPTASALASSWNMDLISQVAYAIGCEAAANGVDIVLGPGTNIKRSPLGGRNFEYYSEDPYLSGTASSFFITGLQRAGVGASLKHFAANNQETRRFVINVKVDEAALNEIYLKPFRIAVRRSRPWTVMAAYNRLNGEYCTESRFLLTDKLRTEFGFDGAVVSDWGAVDDRAAALSAGMDIEMPGYNGDGFREIVSAVSSGAISEACLNDAVRRILKLIDRILVARKQDAPPDMDMHHLLAKKAAEQGAVLLKNDRSTLPLNDVKSIAVIGSFAMHPRYQGAGSSMVNPARLDDALTALKEQVNGRARIVYSPGYDHRTGEATEASMKEAASAAAAADAALVFAGLPAMWETEGRDRAHLSLPEGNDALIKAVSEANKRTAVVLMNGAPVAMPWIGSVGAVLEAYLGGQASGTAVSSLVLGDAVPSGKLAETFPLALEDNPSYGNFPGDGSEVSYSEGTDVGYRHYDRLGKDVLFPFGHGLSYTSFGYSDLRYLGKDGEGRPAFSFRLENTGDFDGAEIAQLYVLGPESSERAAVKMLAGFSRVEVVKGGSFEVELKADTEAFSCWDCSRNGWHIPGGTYRAYIGSSSRDIRLSCDFNMDEAFVPVKEATVGCKPEELAIPLSAPMARPARVDRNTPIGDLSGFCGSIFRFALLAAVRMKTRGAKDDPTMAAAPELLLQMPLRSLTFATDGAISKEAISALAEVFSGHATRGFANLFRHLTGKRRRTRP